METSAESTITSKGQVTIPQAVREAAHLCEGDRLVWHLREGGAIEVRRARRGSLDALVGLLHQPGMLARSVEELDDGIAAYLEGKHAGARDVAP